MRGFADAIAFGDEGHIVRTELLTPFMQISAGEGKTVQFQGLVFYDDARLNNKRLIAGEAANSHLSSFGVGIRLSMQNNISLRIDAGKQSYNDVAGSTPTNLVHVALNATF